MLPILVGFAATASAQTCSGSVELCCSEVVALTNPFVEFLLDFFGITSPVPGLAGVICGNVSSLRPYSSTTFCFVVSLMCLCDCYPLFLINVSYQ